MSDDRTSNLHSPPARGFRPRARAAIGTLVVTVLVGGGLTVAATPASAHGYVNGTVVARAAATQNTDRGAVANEPQSLEAPKGFPESGPADGKLASAGGLFGGVLDQQTATRWWKNPVSAGPLTVTWQYTAPHRTSQWRYYLTKPGWNPNAPLTRSEFELIATVPHDGGAASTRPAHTITIPADRSGYHILYAIWDVADTTNAFYNTIDLDVGAPGQVPTSTPNPTSTPATTAPTTADPTTEHQHSHPATTGNPSTTGSSAATTPPATPAPSSSRPSTTTSTTNAPTTNAPTTGAPTTSPAPSSTKPATSTPPTSTPATTPAPTTGATTAPAWNAYGSYRIGDRVSYQGRVYVCRQNHRGWGDPSWITALALWTPS